VVTGEDRDQRARHGRGAAGPGGKPEGDLFQAAERTRRLGQLCVPLARGHQRGRIRTGQIAQQFTEIIERQAAGTHLGNSLVGLSKAGAS
jgi:hypothetical protein